MKPGPDPAQTRVSAIFGPEPGPGIRVQRLENTGPVGSKFSPFLSFLVKFWHEILEECYPDPQDLVATESFSGLHELNLHFQPGTSQLNEEHS